MVDIVERRFADDLATGDSLWWPHMPVDAGAGSHTENVLASLHATAAGGSGEGGNGGEGAAATSSAHPSSSNGLGLPSLCGWRRGKGK